MKKHDLKCHPQYFEAIKNGLKTFECRYNDRGFQVGDQLILREYDSQLGYSGRVLTKTVTYILSDFIGLTDNFVILSLDEKKFDY